jgi:L-amino acid N-acyltransferase YncA
LKVARVSTIRFAELRDAAAIQAIYAPFCEATTVSFEVRPPSVEEMAERIAQISQHYPWLVCERYGSVAGYVYACRHRERAAYRWAVDVTVYVAAEHQRLGIGRGLYTSLLAMLREQGYVKAYAGITLPNPGSIGVHEAVGFRPVAVYRQVGFKLGEWRDVGWWQKELQPPPEEPAEPVPIGALRHSAAIADAIAAGERLIRGGSVS